MGGLRHSRPRGLTVCGKRSLTVRIPLLRNHHASFIRATNRSWGHAFRPGIFRPPARQTEVGVRSGRKHAVRWEIGSSSRPFSPREFVVPGRVFKPPEARCSPGFSTSPGSSPSSPWADASIGPPLTGFTRDPAPEGAFSLDRHYGSSGRLPLRVSQSDEAGQSLARPAYPHEVLYLVVQPHSSKA